MFNFFRKSINRVIQEQGKDICQKCHSLGVAEGEKIKDRKPTGEKAIVFLVKEKLPKTQLLSSETIPEKLGGYKTDVIETHGDIEPVNGHRGRHRPVIGGISGKVYGGTACTLGLTAYKNGAPIALTNEHCAHYPKGSNQLNSYFLQPSPADGGKEHDKIGIITSSPRIKNNQQNKIDSIFIPLDTPANLEVRKILNYTKKWQDPKVGVKFRKPSRTTDYTEGVISYTNALSRVNYGGSLGVCEFYPTCWAVQNNYDIVNGGDSGSCIFDEWGNVIGQTFAAAPNLAIFMPFSSIVEELGITLDVEKPLEGYIAVNKGWFSDVEVLVNGLRFREMPGLNEKILEVLNAGQRIEILEYGEYADNWHWLKIKKV